MSLEQTINNDIKTAMLAKDSTALRGLRAVKAAILLAKTAEGSTGELTADQELQLLTKLVKQRNDSLTIFKAQNREDLAQKEAEEIATMQKYLPQQLNEAELRTAVQAVIDETGATSLKDLGKVMGIANKRLAGKAEGKAIAELVKRLLSA